MANDDSPIPCDYCNHAATHLSTNNLRSERRFSCDSEKHRAAARKREEPLPGRSRFLKLCTDELMEEWTQRARAAAVKQAERN